MCEKLSKEVAEQIVNIVNSSCGELDRSVLFVRENCEEEFSNEFIAKAAEAMTLLGWDILEQMIYSKYPELRPYDLEETQSDT